MEKIIETKRLYLRNMALEDLDRLYEMYEDPLTRRFLEPLSDDRGIEAEKLEAYINFVYDFYSIGYWAVCEKSTDRMIGRCGFSVEEVDEAVFVEAGYLMAPGSRGKGYAVEALSGAIDYVINELDIRNLAVSIAPDNLPSQGVIAHFPFIYVKEIWRKHKKMYFYTYNLG